MRRNFIVGIFALFLTGALAACAGPDVDRAGAGFDYEIYYTDLNNCRGGSAFEAAVETTGAGLWGSLVGAYYGLFLSVATGDKVEVMLFGAIVGASVGIGSGAVESVNEFNDQVTDCLRAKGYSVS